MFLLVITAVSYGVMWITEMTYIVVTLGKFTPSSSQSSVEGTRETVRLLAALLASLTSAYIYENYVFFFPFSGAIFFLLGFGTICRRQYLKNPLAVEMSNEEISLLRRDEGESE